MAPKCNSNDADNLDMPKRKYKVLLWSAKVKVLDLWGKKSDGEVAKIYGMNESLVYKIVKNKKKFMLLLLSCFKLQKLWTQFMISGADLGLWYLWVVAAMDKFTGTTEILWRKGTAWLLSKWERGPWPLPWRALILLFWAHYIEDGPHLLCTGSLWVVTFYWKQRRGCC